MFSTGSYQPFPTRKDLMYLSTITPEDVPPKKKHWGSTSLTSLVTDDIEGAKPALKGYQYVNKPDFAYTAHDIEKAQPSKLHQALNKPNFNLNTKDIFKAYPNKAEFVTNRIGHNPLMPVYKLPSFETRPITPPKFVRDSIQITDIDGTKPEAYFKWQTRNSMNITDIDGARPKPDKKPKKPNFMDPRDINKGDVVEYGRNTNPLMPQYSVRDYEGKLVTIGEVEGSKPKVLINKSTSPHQRHLNTQDIDGAVPGTVGLGPIGKKDRNEYRQTTNTQDILGAQAGTLKKGITTLRSTHPLDPSYKWVTEDETLRNGQLTNYTVDHTKYWGYAETPRREDQLSRQSTLPPPTGLSKDSEFKVNARKFYANDEDDPNIGFSKNAEKFYSSSPNLKAGNIFLNAINPGSINRARPKFNEIDAETQSFQKNIDQFHGVSPSPPKSEDGGSEDKPLDPEFEYAASKFHNVKATPNTNERVFQKDASKFYEPMTGPAAYQFNLARKDIGRPGKPPQNPLDTVYKKNIAKFYGMTPPGSVDSRNQGQNVEKNSPRSIDGKSYNAESRNSVRSHDSRNPEVKNADSRSQISQ
ncbi:unnamed protein product [Blepharisma stoltei]|uniref:Uncharacterized protein n=1 Tax=Blepharisma stoltei TaxID=1481888 RepID=A0AAU9IJF5_9CILI|nr:unnamed protein product [Blepharisma stoltei]